MLVACATLAAANPLTLASEGAASGSQRLASHLAETWRHAQSSGDGAVPMNASDVAATEAMVRAWVDHAVVATLGGGPAAHDLQMAGDPGPALILVLRSAPSAANLQSVPTYSPMTARVEGQPLTDFQLVCLVLAGFTLVALVTTVLQWRIDRLDAQQGSSFYLPRRTSIG